MQFPAARFWWAVVLFPLVMVAASAGVELPAEPARVSPSVIAFFKAHCVHCHGPTKQNGDVRLDTLPTAIADQAIALQWQDVLDALNLGQMPPPDVAQPPKKELADILETLTNDLAEARRRLTDTGGQVVLRRLNKREYARTIDALFGVPVDVSLLPDDGAVNGFDTVGQAHGFSSLHLERYLQLGVQVLEQVFPSDPKKAKVQAVKSHVEAEVEIRKIEETFTRLTAKMEGRKKSTRTTPPVAVLISDSEHALATEYFARPEVKTGALVPFRGVNPFVTISVGGLKPSPGEYRVRVRCGAALAENESTPNDLFLRVARGAYRSLVPDAVEFFHVTGTTAHPQTIEFSLRIDNVLSNRLQLERREGRLAILPRFASAHSYYFDFPLVGKLLDDRRTDLWIDWVEVEGPLPRAAVPPLNAAKLLAGSDPTKELTEADARRAIEQFCFEAFRRQSADSDYVDRLVQIYAAARDHGDAPTAALKKALVVVLASPRFLYLDEPRPEGQGPRPLTDRELAVRLAYFLWSAPPDDELYHLAEAGQLRDPETLKAQVDRMLQADLADAFVETFCTQWLDLNRLNTIKPEGTTSAQYDEAVQQSSRREVFALFATLLREDLPVTALADADFALVDSVLAWFYDLPGVTGDEFRKVALPKNSPRGGLLGTSAILTLTGTGERTSPVERGAFVLRKLLNRPPAPAPANVPMLDEKAVGARSIRDTLAAHMTSAQCQSCHRRIDPLGFALENFDPVGRWRTEVPSTDGTVTFPIDSRGTMPDGERTFADARQMKRHLAADGGALATGLTEALLTYGVGRTVGFTDQEMVADIVKATGRTGYGARSLLHRIVLSKAFITK